MSNYAIFGDIHGNLEALQAVLHDSEQRGCQHFACLGDIVGYNANPSECVDIIQSMNCPTVKGNHDVEAIGIAPLLGMNPVATAALSWTREMLSLEQKTWIRRLPLVSDKYPDFSLVHASLDSPKLWNYILNAHEASSSFRKQIKQLCFHGHTHVPQIYISDTLSAANTADIKLGKETKVFLEPDKRYFINVGSTGQPRDGDWRASYAIFDSENRTVEICRVEYDVVLTQKKIIDAGLPERLAERLGAGR